MSQPQTSDHELPGFWQSAVFLGKTRLLQLHRKLKEWRSKPPLHRHDFQLSDAPILMELKTPLWSKASPAEFSLTAGKIQNLRVAAKILHGLEVKAGETFSFWRQLGRTLKSKGFVAGRELREGCVIPNVGGGLCQLTGLLYGVALDGGFEIVERHAHSRIMPGSLATENRDATVFWNYVDLRFRAEIDWRLEVELTAADLIVRIRGERKSANVVSRVASPKPQGEPKRAAPSGDCLTCNMTSCFRHPGAIAAHGASLGHSAFLLDARWPELDSWCANHAHAGDRYFLPLDGKRWCKTNYTWTKPAGVNVTHETSLTLWRAWKQSRLPMQGASRQQSLLAADKALANAYAKRLHPECRHVVVSQNLLPFLWRSGALGGRTFDVLLQRWPMQQLIDQLDEAAQRNPHSETLTDFRPDSALVEAESAALVAAGRLVTPHRAMAAHFGSRAILLDWKFPTVKPLQNKVPQTSKRLFFPASALGRKGIHELAFALRGLNVSLDVLGRATEGNGIDVLQGIQWRQAKIDDLQDASALVIPAWIEHQPRLALRALAMGIPVIASAACGLPEHPLLTTLTKTDGDALRSAIEKFFDAFEDREKKDFCVDLVVI